MKPNVLLGVHQFFPNHRTGTEVLTLELARGLRERGYAVQILSAAAEINTYGKESPWLTQDKYDGFVVHRLHFGRADWRDVIPLHLVAPDRIRLVRDLVASMKPDLVHFNHIIGFSGQIIPELRDMGVPVIFTPTDYWVICLKANLFRTVEKRTCCGPEDGVDCIRCLKPMPRWIAGLARKIGQTPLNEMSGTLNSLNALGRRVHTMVEYINAADRVLPATEFLSDVLIRHGLEKEHIKVVPYGIDIGTLPEKISLPPHFCKETPLRLGFIGTLSEMKGPDIMLDAISFLGDETDKVVLDIYGKVDEEDPFCQMLLKKTQQSTAKVQFKGIFPHEKIGEILRALHILIVPSVWYESTPLVLCSALRAGTPILVSHLGGMTEVVREGINGFSYPPGDARALSRILVDIIDHPKKLMKIYRNPEVKTRTTSDYVDDIEVEYLKTIRCDDRGNISQ